MRIRRNGRHLGHALVTGGGLVLLLITISAGPPAAAWGWPTCQKNAGESCNLWDHGWSCCGDLVCDLFAGARCRHNPAWEGEPCSVDLLFTGICKEPGKYYCKGFEGPGLAGKCTAYADVGETCNVAHTLCGNVATTWEKVCRPKFDFDFGFEDAFVCYPAIPTGYEPPWARTFDPSDDESCRALWSKSVHKSLMDSAQASGKPAAHAYSAGYSLGAVAAASFESGVVYGSDGTYACYSDICYGVMPSASVGWFVTYSEYGSYDEFKDGFKLTEVSGGYYAGVALGGIYNASSEQIGRLATFSLSADYGPPLQVDWMWCTSTPGPRYAYDELDPTGLRVVAAVTVPALACSNASVCADPATCSAQASVSTTPGSEPVTVTQSPAGPYAIGSREVTLAPEVSGQATACSATLDVKDCAPPVIQCPAPVNAECQANQAASVTLPPPSVTDCSAYEVSPPPDGPYPLGTTAVSFTAMDSWANTASCETSVAVVDTLPPEIRSVAATPSVLWPPNHEMRNVVIEVAAVDACGTGATCRVAGIASSEPADATGDGSTGVDSFVVGAGSIMLRAEREGSGPGRTYTVTVECRDGSGNASSSSVDVIAPHDNAT